MPSPYLITCSCGRQTQIHWNGQRYFALSSNWTATYPEGWTCGRFGHTQRVPPKAQSARVQQPSKLDIVF